MRRRSMLESLLAHLRSLRPRHVAVLVALAAMAAAYGYAISEEVPVGRIRGQVRLMEDSRAVDAVRVSLTPIETQGDDEDHVRHAVSGSDGRFILSQVPAGSYYLSASTRAHSVSDAYVTVDEGGTAEPVLSLTRSEPDLELAQHQRVFGTAEKVRLPVRGYIDGALPKGTDAVHVRLYKTRLSEMAQSGNLEGTLGQIGTKYDNEGKRISIGLPAEAVKPAHGAAPKLITDREFKIVEADREGFYFQRLDFGSLAPGLYLTQLEHDKAVASTWLLVTDMALVVKRADPQVVAFAADMNTGVPLPGCDVRIYRGASVVASRVTDSHGLAELAIGKPRGGSEGDEEGSGDDRKLMTIAVRGDDESIVERDFYGTPENDGPFVVAAYTDRPIYRPGHRIYFKGIARRAVERGVKYNIPAGEPVSVEVHDPEGEKVYSDRKSTNAYGSFYGHFDLSPEARTGVYSLLMKIAGKEHSQGIVVASYQKPEYEVTVTPNKKIYIRGETVEMTVSGQYYFGAPVAGAKVKYYVDVQPDWASDYPDNYDYDPEEDRPDSRLYSEASYRGEMQNEGEIRLDENGRAVIRFPAESKDKDSPNAPQRQFLTVSARVQDESGREVSTDGKVTIAAGTYRLSVQPQGYLAEPNRVTNVTLNVRDNDGRPVPGVRLNLESGFARWVKDEDTHDSKYRYDVFARQSATSGPDGSAAVAVTPPKSGDVELKLAATDSHGRLIRARAELWCSGDEGGDLQTEFADLSLHTDKRSYLPGERARVLVSATHIGQTVLLGIEGDRIYRTFTVLMAHSSQVIYVPVLPEYGPNISLTACYVQNKHFAQSEAPLRVTVSSRDIKVDVWSEPAANPPPSPPTPLSQIGSGGQTAGAALLRYHPRDTITYHVKTTDAQGRAIPAEFSFGVVDESIYALAEDDPHLLRDTFYPRRHNSVATNYSFAVEYLGGADKTEPKITARKEFPDTVFWEPSLTTDASGLATIRVPLKDSLTTWRATAVGQSSDSAFGRQIGKVISTKEFLVRIETPRFLTEKDESHLVALIHNETPIPQTAFVRLRLEGAATTGEMTRSLSLQPGGVAQAEWQIVAGAEETAKFDVSAWTPKIAGAPQYTDRIQTSIPIRPHGRGVVDSHSGDWNGGETYETPTLDPKAVARESRLTIRISPSVAGSLAGALEYLIGYPYGCTEQTMSRFLPDMLAHRLARMGVPQATVEGRDLDRMVRDGLTRLGRFQHKTGAWGWWEYDEDDAWMTGYVLQGLAIAQTEGYRVDPRALAKGLKGATELLARTKDDDNKAFLIYALALAGGGQERLTAKAVRGSLRLATLRPPALACIVLLDRLVGEDSREAVDTLMRESVSQNGALAWSARNKDYHGWDDRMSTALGLRALLAAAPNDPRINDVLRGLMRRRTGDYWEDTKSTSFAVHALCDYLNTRTREAAPTGEIVVQVNGRPVQSYTLSPQILRESDLILRVPATLLRPGKNDVKLVRSGGASTVFYSVELKQVVSEEDMPAYTTSRMTVKRELLRRVPRKAGQDHWTIQTEPTNNRLHQGDRLLVRLTIEVPAELSYVLIEDPFPPGCEVTERGTSDEVAEWSYWWSSVDVRDDRIAFFARTLTPGMHVIEYNLRAQTPGSYHTMPTLVQPMYEPAIKGYSAESRVDVR